MKNILITGVSGYLGRELVSELRVRDDIGKIVGIDIVPPSEDIDDITFCKMDIRDQEIGRVMSEHSIDTIFHLAFVVTPIHNKKLMHDIDYNGTRNVLEKAKTANVKHVISISSTLAYGAHKDNPDILKEEDRLRGNENYPYGYNKAIVDYMVQDYANKNPDIIITILRPCTVFGPHVDNYVSRLFFMPVITTVAGASPRAQFVHEKDFVRACLIAMEKQVPGVFNIVGEGTLAFDEISEIIGAKVIALPACFLYPLLEILWQLRIPGISVNRGYLDYTRYIWVASSEKAKKELGFSPKYTSKETLEETVRSKKDVKDKKKK